MTDETRDFIRNCSEAELVGLLGDFIKLPESMRSDDESLAWIAAIQEALKQPRRVPVCD